MNTPDEIKKWLEYCLGTDDCVGCIYHEDCNQSYRTHIIIDSRDCIRQLEAQVPKWISVKERLPEKGKYVLCLYMDDVGDKWQTVGRVQFWNDKWDLDIDADAEYRFVVTHWMPLPEPPKEDDCV